MDNGFWQAGQFRNVHAIRFVGAARDDLVQEDDSAVVLGDSDVLVADARQDVRELDDPADYEEAERAAALYRKLGDSFHEGRALLRAGTARLTPDNVEEGEGRLRKAHALVRPSGATKTLARCLSALASARLFADDLKKAQVLHEEAIGVDRQLGEVLD